MLNRFHLWFPFLLLVLIKFHFLISGVFYGFGKCRFLILLTKEGLKESRTLQEVASPTIFLEYFLKALEPLFMRALGRFLLFLNGFKR